MPKTFLCDFFVLFSGTVVSCLAVLLSRFMEEAKIPLQRSKYCRKDCQKK